MDDYYNSTTDTDGVCFTCLLAENRRRILCAHADRNGEGAHWKYEGDPCP